MDGVKTEQGSYFLSNSLCHELRTVGNTDCKNSLFKQNPRKIFSLPPQFQASFEQNDLRALPTLVRHTVGQSKS